MNKKCIALLLALLLAFAAVGCETVTVNREKDMAQVVAVVGDKEITKGEIYDQVQGLMAMYYGIDIYDETLSDDYREYIFEFLVDSLDAEVDYQLMSQICEKESPLTAEEIAAVEEEAEEYFDQLRSILGYDAEDPDKYEGDIEADLDEYLEKIGYTRQKYIDDLLVNARYDKMKEQVYAAIEVAESQIQDQWLDDYGTQMEAAKLSDEFATYKSLVNPNGNSVGDYVLYKAEGFIMVKQILLKYSEADQKIIADLQDKISDAETDVTDLEEEYDIIQDSRDKAEKEEDEEEVARLNERLSEKRAEIKKKEQEVKDAEAELEKAIKTAEESLQPKIEEVQAALKEMQAAVAKKSDDKTKRREFDKQINKLIEKYGEDQGMKVEPSSLYGYLIAPDTKNYSAYDTWEKAFVDAARSLKEMGDFSEPAATSYGVHLVSLVYGTEACEVDYEYNRGVTLEKTEETLGAEAWEKELEARWEEYGVKTYESRLKYEK